MALDCPRKVLIPSGAVCCARRYAGWRCGSRIHQDLAQVNTTIISGFMNATRHANGHEACFKMGFGSGKFWTAAEAKRHAALNRSIVPVSWLSAPKALSPLRFASAVQSGRRFHATTLRVLDFDNMPNHTPVISGGLPMRGSR